MKRQSLLLSSLLRREQSSAGSGDRRSSQRPGVVINARKPSWQVPVFDVAPLGIRSSARRTPSAHLTKCGLASNGQMESDRGAFGCSSFVHGENSRRQNRSMQVKWPVKHKRRRTQYRSCHRLSRSKSFGRCVCPTDCPARGMSRPARREGLTIFLSSDGRRA